ncbi:MAG: hypothetical protein HYX94_04065 [Chloroflexi bacterium]|nr:hypothetical protein [Chloroflexota bacterium]
MPMLPMGFVAVGVCGGAGQVVIALPDGMHRHPIDLVGDLLDGYAGVVDGDHHRAGCEVALIVELETEPLVVCQTITYRRSSAQTSQPIDD